MQSNFQEKDNIIRNKSFDFQLESSTCIKFFTMKEMKKLYQSNYSEVELQSEQI